MDVNTPTGLLNRMLWKMTLGFCLRSGTQVTDMRMEDLAYSVVEPGSSSGFGGWGRLEYLESHTKTNQGGIASAKKAAARKNPVILMDPNLSQQEKECSPVWLYLRYRDKSPNRVGHKDAASLRYFLAPKTHKPKVCVSFFILETIVVLLNTC